MKEIEVRERAVCALGAVCADAVAFVLVATLTYFAYPRATLATPDLVVRGISNAQVCRTAKERFLRNLGDAEVAVRCESQFHHYNADAAQKYYAANADQEIRIGSFNL